MINLYSNQNQIELKKSSSLNATHQQKGKLNTVLIGLGFGLGNAIQVTPLINFLHKNYNSKIDILLEADIAYMQEALQSCKQISNVFIGNDFLGTDYYDLALFSKTSGKAVIWVPANIYLNLELLFPFLTYTRYIHEAQYPFECLKKVGIIYNYTRQDYSNYFISNNGWQPSLSEKNLVLIHAGCKGGRWEKKKWPYFKTLSMMLIKAGFKVGSLGSTTEYINGTLNYTGLPLMSTIEMIKKASLVVSNDSGVMHIADALRTPLLTIFGPSSVIKNGPLNIHSRVKKTKEACSPCQFSLLIDSCLNNQCMKTILVDDIYRDILNLINKNGFVIAQNIQLHEEGFNSEDCRGRPIEINDDITKA